MVHNYNYFEEFTIFIAGNIQGAISARVFSYTVLIALHLRVFHR